jgi:NRPS condensation-like uncharacterized protein
MNQTTNKFALDNAAKIYPAAMTKKWNSVFGVSVHIKDKVNPLILKRAVIDLVPRFPSFYVRLKKEFFWDVLVPAHKFDIVEKEIQSPCRPIEVNSKSKPLFRVVYNEHEIRTEFFHSVTDGNGAITYLKALLLRYFELCDNCTYRSADIKNHHQKPTEDEIRDDFQGVYKKGIRCSRTDDNAYQINFEIEKDYLSSTKICMPIDEVKNIAKNVYGCTVTQYVATAYALALLSKYDNSKRAVKLSIPVNLRPYFDSQTLRNFSSYVTINVTPQNDRTFESVLELIKKGMAKKIKKENFVKAISQNIADEKMLISRYSPNAIKRLVMRQCFKIYGEKKYTSTVSSMGYIKMPQEISDKINYFSATIGETYINKINCAVLGFDNTLCVNIASASKDMSIQNRLIDIIKSTGVECEIETPFNDYEDEKLIAG